LTLSRSPFADNAEQDAVSVLLPASPVSAGRPARESEPPVVAHLGPGPGVGHHRTPGHRLSRNRDVEGRGRPRGLAGGRRGRRGRPRGAGAQPSGLCAAPARRRPLPDRGPVTLEAPDRAGVVLTLLLAAAFFVGGVLRIVFSLIDQLPAWPWVLLNGVVNLILGVLIWRGWPESSLWVIGLFVGIELFLHGWSWVVLALSARPVSAAPST